MGRAGKRLSLNEAAEALGISAVTTRRWIKSGKLRAYKPGLSYQVPVSAIEELLNPDKARVEQAPEEIERILRLSPEELLRELSELSDEEVRELWMSIGKEQRRRYDKTTPHYDAGLHALEVPYRVVAGEVSKRDLQRYQVSIPASSGIPYVTFFHEPTEEMRAEIRDKFGPFVEVETLVHA